MTEPARTDGELGVPPSAAARLRLRDRAECRERLREIASQTGGEPLAAMIGEAKLLRATLVLGTGSALGAHSSALVPPAVSIEILHLASLVHDDMIDEATERRGVSALHVVEGRDRALVVGDLLIAAAFDAMSRIRGTVTADVFADALGALATSALSCCEGQLEELDPGRTVRSEADYLEIAAKKAGSLFCLAASLGAIVAEAGEYEIAALADFGAQLGTAYQIRDDMRDRVEDGRRRPHRDHRVVVRPFSPDLATYSRALIAVGDALDRVPPPCKPALRHLVDTMLPGSTGPRHATPV